MTDMAWMVAATGAGPTAPSDHLDRLVSRIAAGDRLAFRCLYAFLAVRVWRTVARALPHPGDTHAVVRSTFLEVWHTAGAAACYDARDWVEAITAFRIGERRSVLGEHGPARGSVPGTAGRREPAADVVDYDDRTDRELTDLLGAGPATVRISPATFLRVENLDRAIDTIAASTGRHPRRPGRHHPARGDWETAGGREPSPTTSTAVDQRVGSALIQTSGTAVTSRSPVVAVDAVDS